MVSLRRLFLMQKWPWLVCYLVLNQNCVLANAWTRKANAWPRKADARQRDPRPDIADMIRQEEMVHSQLMDTVGYLADVYGPRLTGSPDIKAAEEWVMSRLTSWGLQNAQLEPWGPFGRGWSLEGFTANVLKPAFSPLIAYPKAWSPGTSGTVRGRPVYIDAASEGELATYRGKLAGAIVLISAPREIKPHFEPTATRLTSEELLRLANARPGEQMFAGPTSEQRAEIELTYKKWQLVYRERPAVVLQASRGDGGTVFVQSATVPLERGGAFDGQPVPWSLNAGPIIPQANVAAEQYNRIVRLLKKGVPVELEVNIQSRFYDQDLMSYNVTAEMPGTELKNELVMLGGCIDSWHAGTGATDNAAGVAVCMEAVRILQALGVKPRRTIRVAFWSGEEQGILGSRAYVTKHFGVTSSVDPTGKELKDDSSSGGQPEKVSVYFNVDDGTGKIRGVYLQGHEAERGIFAEWLAPFKDMGATTISILNSVGTDHVPFNEAGIPGFMFIRDGIEYYSRTAHSNMDTYDHVIEDDLKQAAMVVAWFVYNSAMRDEMLPR